MPITITDRDEEILRHIAIYRLTTREVLHQEWFADSNINAVTKVCSKLAKHGFLNRYPLYSDSNSRSYYVLGTSGIKHQGVHRSESKKKNSLSQNRLKAFGPQSLINHFAVLGFCHFGTAERRKLTQHELKSKYADCLQNKERPQCYFWQDGERPIFGHLIVDHNARYDHTIRKCVRVVLHSERLPGIAKLIDNGQFAVTVATSTDARAIQLRRRIENRPWNVPVTVEVVPDLFHVIEHNSQNVA